MSVFAYTAKRGPDDVETGTLEAESQEAAAGRLMAKGLHPVSIKHAEESGGNRPLLSALSRMSRGDVAAFARQLASLIGTGLPVLQALETISGQAGKRVVKDILLDIRDRVEKGDSLSSALAAHPKVFPRLFFSLIYAGEHGGVLSDVLERIADYYEGEQELRGRVLNATIYPLFLLTLGVITVFVLVSFVLPNFVALFEDIAADLPLPTQLLIAVSSFAGRYWWLVLVVVAALVLLIRQFHKTDAGAKTIDGLLLRVPIARELIMKREVSRLGRTLSALLENGVPVLSALSILEETVGNRDLRQSLGKIRKEVEDGARMGEAFRRNGRFPPLMISMVTIGEESGTLPAMLSRIATAYETEVQAVARRMAVLLEPLLILAVGSCIGLIVFSILLPIFRINILLR